MLKYKLIAHRNLKCYIHIHVSYDIYRMFQSIGSLPYCSSASLHREKHLQDTPLHTNEIKMHRRACNQNNPYLEPMKGDDVLYAPSGDGCDVLIMVLYLGSMPLHLQTKSVRCAWL
jgi:hypothetical protein